MALMILMDKTAKSLENGEFAIGVFLDFSKAFDTINHDVLLQKYSITVLEVPLWNGFGAIPVIDVNM